ncbi:helix-turn-helix transcriptional regulator [Nitriliruptoraceae bacterium ZYF776]|nr:helix-turn-helix transcriptional regulator [Profundirhabdus halotolerans]
MHEGNRSIDRVGDATDPDLLATAVDALRLIAEPTRLQLLWRLRDDELDVSTLAEQVGATPTAVSQHLAKLKLAGLVAARRDGRHVRYRLLDDHVLGLVAEALYHAEHRLHP